MARTLNVRRRRGNRWAGTRTCVLALVVLMLAGCGGGSSPAQPPGGSNPPPFVVASGPFDVTAQKSYDTCTSTTNYTGTYDIQIDGESFAMGDQWSGTWDAKNVQGIAETDHVTVTHRYCTVTTWTAVNVTFSSEDEFTGSITFRRRVDGACSTDCITTWTVHGVRQGSTP